MPQIHDRLIQGWLPDRLVRPLPRRTVSTHAVYFAYDQGIVRTQEENKLCQTF